MVPVFQRVERLMTRRGPDSFFSGLNRVSWVEPDHAVSSALVSLLFLKITSQCPELLSNTRAEAAGKRLKWRRQEKKRKGDFGGCVGRHTAPRGHLILVSTKEKGNRSSASLPVSWLADFPANERSLAFSFSYFGYPELLVRF